MAGKKSRQKIAVLPFMIVYQLSLYKEILECYEYETRNSSIYGNVVRGEVELTQGRKELQPNRKGNEDYIQ